MAYLITTRQRANRSTAEADVAELERLSASIDRMKNSQAQDELRRRFKRLVALARPAIESKERFRY
jgi:hypothetical protein